MKVVTIGSDRGLFNTSSTVRARIAQQAALFDELHVVVFALASLGLQEVHAGNLHIYPTNSTFKIGYIFDAARIAKRINDISVISTQDPFEAGLAGWLATRHSHIPLQLQVHTDFLSPYFISLSWLNRARVLVARFLLPRAAAIRVVSERIKKSIEDHTLADRAKITVLPIFIEQKNIEPVPLHMKYPQFKKIVVVVSRLEKEKNVAGAIKAFSEACKTMPDIGLVVVGGGSQKKQLEARAASLGLSGAVIFEGVRPAAGYYQEADVLLASSLYEGYGLVVVEALAAGCPVVSTDVGIAKEAGAQVGSFQDLGKLLINVLKSEARGTLLLSLITEEEYLAGYKQSLETASLQR